ncbi:hypothetical protein BGW38_009414 [Lunasporangiospora selenospora]|uniref:Uncharacterized protein n=1 Tax=Lunasporangiospora selenospora TaxID=979761 RepID=A0A9P6KFB8_9FUNG|nr:hypothetical protein BGW38_009414 [Lunasporangiospora selenospora]
MVKPDTSYVVAICYLTFLCVVAVIMCLRSKTRLRIYACLLTYLGLSIAVLGLLQAKFMISANWFWAWNFAAEGVAVVILTLTIVSVGSGFYPMAGNKNIYWRMSMGVIMFYGTVAFANVVYYAYTKLIPHDISPMEVQQLRANIIDAGIFTEADLRAQRYFAHRRGTIPPGDAAVTGHQVLMLLNCMWVVMYLFIPLVRHHRHGPVGRPIDSDMMAVGVWYLSSLMTVALAYAILNIIFCIDQELIFEQQAQAFDLCLRITIGPIFFLPAPAFLIRFYRKHFQKFKGNSSGGRNKGSGGRTWGSGNRYGINGSFTNSEVPEGFNGSHSISPEGTRVGSRLDTSSAARGSIDLGTDGQPSKHLHPTSPTNYGKLRFFPTRDRGHSVESSRGLNRDFESESSLSHNISESGHLESSPSFSHHMDGHRGTPLRNSVVISYDFDEKFPEVVRASSSLSHPLQDDEVRSYPVNTPQQPKPALTPENLKLAAENPGKNGYLATSAHSESSRRSPTGDSDRTLIRTRWEVGGYEPQAPGGSKSQALTPSGSAPTNTTTPNATYLDVEGLTGLQKQLAEHQSTLLSQAIAYRAHFEERNSDELFDQHRKPPIERDPEPDFPHPIGNEMASRELFSMTAMASEPSGSGSNRVYTRGRDTDFDTYTHPASHAVDSIHWSMPSSSSPPKNKADFSGGYHHQDDNPYHYYHSRDSKHKDGILSTFSKVISHKPGHTKSSSQHSSQHNRSQQDHKDRVLDHHGDGYTDASTKGQAVATVEELTMNSVRRYQELDEHYTKDADAYNYSDPYDNQGGFKSKSTTSVVRPAPSGGGQTFDVSFGILITTRVIPDSPEHELWKQRSRRPKHYFSHIPR